MSTTPTPNPQGLIRNIVQSVQNRDVIKQASDIIVYIDGADYLVNPYLGDSGINVPFNNFVNSWQSTYDIDAMVPSGSLTLVVPVQDQSLFELPGGNKILKSMAEIRVFAKGFYFSQNGNTMYRQIFKGYITAVNSVNDGTTVTYTLPCRGALGLLERMQIDQQPATMSSSPLTVTPFSSSQHNLDPYKMIAWVFLYSSMVDGFELYGLQNARMERAFRGPNGEQEGNPYYEAVEERYVAKWQALLYDLARDVHIFGAPNVQDIIKEITASIKKPDASQTPWNKEALGIWADQLGTESESTQVTQQTDFYTQLRGYLPDFQISTIQLFNGRVTTRLERLRHIVSLIGFEAYQDIDGAIVIKPPLYNLDVVNLFNDGSVANVPADPTPDPSLAWITDATNPFVIQASEIAPGESETEDEAGVRLTRITARGNYNPGFQFQAAKELLTVAEDIDVAKLAQYGLRTEPPREAPWFRDGDDKAIYAYAASEMARANKGYRTFAFSIPLRPELKLGFPLYFPHKDMYGYIKSVTMNWTKGGDATTSVICDSLRYRPLFPEDQNVPIQGGQGQQKVRFMTQQPNLVMQWTKAGENPSGQNNQGQQSAKLTGKIATLPYPQQLIVDQQVQMLEARKADGLLYTPNNDTGTHNWRIQPDQTKAFTAPRVLDDTYYETLRTTRPYTDEKGYELLGPFPWGRWKSLKDSLSTFTIANPVFNSSQAVNQNPALQPVNAGAGVLTNADAFLFTGDSIAASTEAATELVGTLTSQRTAIDSFKVFELAYSADPTNAPGPGSTLGASAAAQPQADPVQSQTDQATSTFLSGQPVAKSVFDAILESIPNDENDNLGLF